MKNIGMVFFSLVLLFALLSCSSSPTPVTTPKTKQSEKVSPVVIDFGPYWKGTIRLEKKAKPNLGNNAEVKFYSEWTLGEKAGNVYPKKFTLSNSGKEVKMNFLWDHGGDIPSGTYDVVVNIDGMPGTGSIKNLKLEKGTFYNLFIVFKAAKIDITLKTDGDEIIVYPAGTYDKYKKLGRLDNIPKQVEINHLSSYTERNPIYWLIPADIPLDILWKHSNGDIRWFKNYKATPESFIKHLP